MKPTDSIAGENMSFERVKSVLIVDDDEVTVFITEMLLNNHGFQTHLANSGYAALELLEEHSFDAILMDINLGDIHMDGIKTMRLIRQDKKFRDTRIFAVTSYSNNRKWFLEQGFNDLLIKPFVSEMILSSLSFKSLPKAVVL